ncbi:MAG: RnfABCDGE type electron transport complex subunit D [Oscillospiraceae bacterium]|nr:RnfABCDGE type electron transport complex subunit D [Oscillospiraceae bacterium]
MEILETNVQQSRENRKLSFLNRKPRHIYGDQLLFLLVLLAMAVIKSGTRSILLAGFAVLASVIIDILCCYFTKKIYNPRDLSTITSGLCLALMSPATLPYSLLIFGASLAIGVKHIFGGKDNYIFNPTATAFAFLIICYPASMLLFPAPGEILHIFGEVPIAASVGLENLLLHRGEFPVLPGLDLILGNFPGPIGTTHVLIIIISAVCLLFRRSVSFVVTISCLSVITISRIVFPIYDDVIGALVRELFGGYLLFALLFLANDPQTVPKTVFGRLYYGVLLGVLTIVFRGSNDGMFRGRVEGWFIFALLIANAFSYRMDIVAARVADTCALFMESMRIRLSAYERFSEEAKSGIEFTGDITATMEIDLDPSSYNMPAIDNKVIKVNRKKRNVLTVISDFFGSLQDIAKKKRETPKTAENNPSFIAESYKALFDTVKQLKPNVGDDVLGVPEIPETSEDSNHPVASRHPSKEGNDIKITDFDEIAETVSEIEAKVEAELEAKRADEAAQAAAEAALAAKLAAEEEEKARIEAEKAEAKAQAELDKALAKAQAEVLKAEAKAQREIEKAEAKAAKEAQKEAEKQIEIAKNTTNVGADVPVRPLTENEEPNEHTENESPSN